MRRAYFLAGPAVDLYDAWHGDDRGKPYEGDVAFYLRQARRTGGPVLEQVWVCRPARRRGVL